MAGRNPSTMNAPGESGVGDFNWVDLENNWREADAEWIQSRSIVRISGATPDVLADSLNSVSPGRVFYSSTESKLVVCTGIDSFKSVLASGVLKATDTPTTSSLSASVAGSPSITFPSGSSSSITISKAQVTSLTADTFLASDLTVSGLSSLAAGTGALACGPDGLTLNTTSSSSSAVTLTTGVPGLSLTKPVTATGLVSTGPLSVSGSTTLTGSLVANGPSNSLASLSVSGTSSLAAASLSGNLSVTGTSTLTGTLTANGNSTFGGAVGVSGLSTLSGGLALSGGGSYAFTVTGTSYLTGSLTVAKATTAPTITSTNTGGGPNLRLTNTTTVQTFDRVGSASVPPTMSPSSGTWTAGDVIRDNDSTPNLWYCKTGGTGTASKWTRISGTGLNFLSKPRRVYNSLDASNPFILTTSVSSRTLSLSSFIPDGSTGALINVTLFGSLGNGHLLVLAGDVATPVTLDTSSINWYTPTVTVSGTTYTVSGPIVVNEVCSPVSSSKEIKIVGPAAASGTNSTHYIIDIVGFFF